MTNNLKPFQPGQSGNPNGRPKSSRHKLSEAFLSAIVDDFEEHGVAAIEQARENDPVAYLRVCASLLPKELNMRTTPLDKLTDDELDESIRQSAEALGLEVVKAKGKPSRLN